MVLSVMLSSMNSKADVSVLISSGRDDLIAMPIKIAPDQVIFCLLHDLSNGEASVAALMLCGQSMKFLRQSSVAAAWAARMAPSQRGLFSE
ncbi:unnamed protein product [Urochloa humidicola]